MTRFLKPISIVGLITVILFSSTFAQSIGLNYGVAGVENYDPTHTFHINFIYPLQHGYFTKFTLMSWTGEDGNLATETKYNNPHYGQYYGNKGVNFSVYKELTDNYKHNFAAGIGIGFYQMQIFNDLNAYELFDPAISFHLRYQQQLANKIVFVSEGNLQFNGFDVEFDGLVPGGLTWGFLTFGLEYQLFK